MPAMLSSWPTQLNNWIERGLRELRGEGRSPKLPEGKFIDRINEFIEKIKAAGDVPKAKAKPKAKGKAEVKDRTRKENPEPQHETFDKALEAAKACKKCTPTRAGIKGCRACMGEICEEIRQRAPTRLASEVALID